LKVAITDAAERDLEDIGDWIARDNPGRALSFVRELRTCCMGLSRQPKRFQVVARYALADVRRRVHGAYLIFYVVARDEIKVIRILHGARDFEPLLFPGDQPD
jgi:toxin ParE1/3/4